ncbi:APC family permease [Flavisolibacter nicotianae]|uniref:APC family permease n=1 Tax=Flavisolibacter nicotianae TaxID=2364882 RepID=UPI000EB41E23|nr:APC family permease [Flavisolibacter nicotianae]
MELLKRRLTLLQATAINMIDMVGIGPFVVLPLVIREFNSPLFLWAWIAGALLALIDGMIWSELGAAYPLAGGSYNFLRIAYGPKWGRLASFLFVWQTAIQAPMVLASGSIGFATYAKYLLPSIEPWQQKAVSVGVILFVTFLLYRKIESVGRLSLFLWVSVLGTMAWIIAGGLLRHSPQFSLPLTPSGETEIFSAAFLLPLSFAAQKTVYSYLGYYNVCHLGSEIVRPERNIPRSIFFSIVSIAVLYIGMNISIVSVVPWQEAQHVDFVISVFMEKAFGPTAANVATALVLLVAFSSLFAVLLGYSRVPFAAARDGNFFPVFARLHPTKNFPHISLLFISGLAILFSFLFSLKQVISAILAMRILVQFIAQAIGVIRLRKKRGVKDLPFKMWLYPLPVVVSILIWLALFVSTKMFAIWGTCMALAGVVVFYMKEKRAGNDALPTVTGEEI